MERVWIDSSDINLKSAFRNLKSAILLVANVLCALLARRGLYLTTGPLMFANGKRIAGLALKSRYHRCITGVRM